MNCGDLSCGERLQFGGVSEECALLNTQRLVPEIPFPPYSYVPRRFPHPTRDPEGHSHGREAAAVEALTEENWRDSFDYLFGVDLFNHGYYWEAHEFWEGLWHACGRAGEAAGFLKALIKLAAAGVKAREGNENGVRRAALRAGELFGVLANERGGAGDVFLGMSVADLVGLSGKLAGEAARVLNTEEAPVIVALPIRLRPAVS